MLKKYLIFFSSVVLVITIFFAVCSTYFGNNPLNISLTRKNKLISFLPEGWAFFTISAKAPLIYFFEVKLSKPSEIKLRNFSLEYCLGFNRDNRVLNIQLDHLHNKLNPDSIVEYNFREKSLENLMKKLNIDTLNFNDLIVDNKIMPSVNEGKYIVVIKKTLPWSMMSRNINYPTSYVVVPVKLKKTHQ
jgi:hypothetical protein